MDRASAHKALDKILDKKKSKDGGPGSGPQSGGVANHKPPINSVQARIQANREMEERVASKKAEEQRLQSEKNNYKYEAHASKMIRQFRREWASMPNHEKEKFRNDPRVKPSLETLGLK